MSASRNVHLLVLIHGMWGNPVHLEEMCRIISETKGSKGSVENATDTELEVLVANSNGGESTYDGIDWGAERVADEVSGNLHSCQNQKLKMPCDIGRREDKRARGLWSKGDKVLHCGIQSRRSRFSLHYRVSNATEIHKADT